MLKRKVLLMGAVSAAVVTQALAADRTISNNVTTPVATQNADNGPGNISITTTGSVVVNGTDPAATVNSANTLTNDGAIGSSAASNAVGVRLEGGVTGGAYIQNGTINLTGTGSNNTAIKVDGSGPFTGSLTLNSGSTVNFQGKDSTGIVVATPFIGDISLNATIAGFGENTRGVVVTQSVTGAFSNRGTILVNGTNSFNSAQLDPQSGAALSIGGSITGGLLNDGPASTDDTTAAANLNTIGASSGLLISPTVAATPGDITIGVLTAANTPGGFSFINRGNIITDGNDPGVSATAARIEGSATTTTSLPGGMYNRGTIRASATTANLTASSQPAADANATGLFVGEHANIAQLVNDGTFFATVSGTKGGTAAAIDISQTATLPSIVNTSFITSSAVTTDDTLTNLSAYGIRDRSGTLTSIDNVGTIAATGTATATTNAFTAVDVSRATSAVTFNNFGTVTGNVLFGQGANTFRIETTGSSAANATGRFKAAGSGTLDINLISGRLKTDDTDVRDLNVGAGGVVEFALNSTTPATAARPLIKATGAVTFADGAGVVLTPTSFLPDRTEYVLLTASSLSLPADLLQQQQLPFLFQTPESGLRQSGNNLTLQLRRKTATELALTGNSAVIFEPAFAAAATDDAFGAALLSLGSQDEVQTTLRSLLPNISAGARALTIAATDQATGPIGARQRGMITTPKQGLGFYAEQFYEDINTSTTAANPSYFASGLGLSVGAEWGNLEDGRYGVGYTYFAGQVTERHPRSSKQDVGLHMFSLYGGWRFGDLFVTPQANVGIGSYRGSRLVEAGSFKRTPHGNWTAYLVSGGGTVGYVLNMGPVQVIPQVSLDGFYMTQTAYSENGGGTGIDLSLDSRDAKSVRLFAGVVAQSGFQFEGGRVQPQVLAGWSRELMNDPSVIDASFEALPGSPFAVVGPTSDPSRLIGGASFAYILDNWSAGVNYDASHASGSFAQSATVNITSRF